MKKSLLSAAIKTDKSSPRHLCFLSFVFTQRQQATANYLMEPRLYRRRSFAEDAESYFIALLVHVLSLYCTLKLPFATMT